jgi:CTP:molybdopterin cytidylyltransferase MocA
MGVPKALLEIDGRSFLDLAVSALSGGGCARVVVAVGPPERPEAEEIARAARALGAEVVRNAAESAEQVDSLRAALRPLPPEAVAVVATPVDLPRIGAGVVRSLIEAFRRRGAPVVLPTHGGARGHPALFARSVFPALLAPGLPEGARSVIAACGAAVQEVPVEQPGILRDVDTPEALRRLRGGEA